MANQEFQAYVNSRTEDTTPDIAADFVPVYDASATTTKKVKPQNLVGTILAALRSAFTPASASGPASLDLAEDTDNGTNYVRVIAPASIGSNRTATLQDETGILGFRDLGQNSQSAAYTLVLGDAGKMILHPAADNNARTFTIPANSSVAFPVGTVITFINEINTVTIAITTDTLVLAGAGSTGSRTLAANGIATAVKITSTKWMISGVGLT